MDGALITLSTSLRGLGKPSVAQHVTNTTLYSLSMVGSSVTPALRRPKQEDYKLQVSLGYISARLKTSRKGTAMPRGAHTVSTEQSCPSVIFFIATTS